MVPQEAIEQMLQSVGSFVELMDTVGAAKDSEKDEVLQAELRKRLLAGFTKQG